jgi:hypothetical protein
MLFVYKLRRLFSIKACGVPSRVKTDMAAEIWKLCSSKKARTHVQPSSRKDKQQDPQMYLKVVRSAFSSDAGNVE